MYFFFFAKAEFTAGATKFPRATNHVPTGESHCSLPLLESEQHSLATPFVLHGVTGKRNPTQQAPQRSGSERETPQTSHCSAGNARALPGQRQNQL